MENDLLVINPSVLLRVVINDPYKVELIDNLSITPAIKAKALTPYLNSLFKSLSFRGDKLLTGVPKYALNEVMLYVISVFIITRINWRKNVWII